MKQFIKAKLREQLIDGQQMNHGTQVLCDKLNVNTYEEGLNLIIAAIGKPEENPNLWARISKPLQMWKQSNTEINKEKHTTDNGSYSAQPIGMTGDSNVDESDTWWAAIQSTICEQGSNFQ